MMTNGMTMHWRKGFAQMNIAQKRVNARFAVMMLGLRALAFETSQPCTDRR